MACIPNRMVWRELRDGYFVNLGNRISTLVADHISAGTRLALQAGNGMPGMGTFPYQDEVDLDVIKAGKLARLGRSIGSVDLIELHEAGILDDTGHVNPYSGVLLRGHRLGISRARLVTTSMPELEQTGCRRPLTGPCFGIGQGLSLALERGE